MISLVLALLACYGTLMAVALLPLLGLGLALNEGIWAAVIVLFVVATLLALIAGIRRQHSVGPPLLGAIAAGIVIYALWVDYHVLTELVGFVLLMAATGWNLYRRRR